jgi:hypothetical protein
MAAFQLGPEGLQPFERPPVIIQRPRLTQTALHPRPVAFGQMLQDVSFFVADTAALPTSSSGTARQCGRRRMPSGGGVPIRPQRTSDPHGKPVRVLLTQGAHYRLLPSLDALADLPIERVIIPHGDLILSDGAVRIRAAVAEARRG